MSESRLQEEIPETLSNKEDFFVVKVVDPHRETVLEKSIKLKNRYDFNLENFVPNDICTDLLRFFNLAGQVIEDAQEREGIIESSRIKLVEDFVEEEFQTFGSEVITYKLISRGPGNMDTKAMSRPQRRPGFSYNLLFEENPNKVIVVESMPKDHVIEFTVWSKSASIANRRALWLEKLFIDHSWAFTSKGVEKFYWNGRGSDTIFTASGQRLYQRPLRFFVRLREFHSVAHPAIRNYEFELSV